MSGLIEELEDEIGTVTLAPDSCIAVFTVAKPDAVAPEVRLFADAGASNVQVDLDLDDAQRLHNLLGQAIEQASKEER
jgi:hypothetical protein